VEADHSSTSGDAQQKPADCRRHVKTDHGMASEF
jgi:hypothetical protein